MRWLLLVVAAACSLGPTGKPPADAAPAPAPKQPEPPPPPLCPERSLHECSADATTVTSGPALTVKLSESVTQGIANGRTFDEPYWDCDVFVIGAARVYHQAHHADDLVFKVPAGKYVVRLDSCFGCRHDVEATVGGGRFAQVRGSCHTQGK